ncbi:MAG: leucyl/phenylalanyl-tRNA--protein transferase [Hahellaceae bacterium]|nr:leucyl/phenylalanyl-tRNA--protein transferase [Hahellaceae bacterium]
METRLAWLETSSQPFPPPDSAFVEPNGLLCAGGDLSTDRLLMAYRQGIFPWYEEGQPILWWSPDPRCILQFTDLHVSRSMQRLLKRQTFQFAFNRAFSEVVAACAAPRSYSHGTWITPEMAQAYAELHRRGHAHSIEVYDHGELVGGLYGIAMGRCFFGESMFSRRTDASKAAFIVLARHLEAWGYAFMDCQVTNPHLLTLGAREVPRDTFLSILSSSVEQPSGASWSLVDELTL